MKFELAACLLLIHVSGTATMGCVPRRYASDSVVCLCNATFCDSLTTSPVPTGQFTSYTSSRDGLRFHQKFHDFVNESNSGAGVVLHVDFGTSLQQIIGFGGAFTDAAGINIKSLSNEAQRRLIRSYFHEEGLQYTMGRVPMGGCDFSPRPYTYDDFVGDTTLSNFSLQREDLLYKIPIIQEALQLSSRPVKLFGSPWSAPAWMKTNDKLSGLGVLKPEYYQAWADYFVRFLEEYRQHNITFWGVTAQNEPMDGLIPFFSFNAMGWTAETQRDWLRDHLGPTLASSDYRRTSIIMLDDNRISLPSWADTVLGDTEAAKYVAGTGVHWYMNFLWPPTVLSETHEKYPEKFILSTEACNGFLPWNFKKVDLGSWKRAEYYAQDIIQSLNHWVGGWVDWNIALDLEGGPNWASNFVDSPIIVNQTADEFYKQPMYYALAHFTKFLTPGSTRVNLTMSGDVEGIQSTSFVTPENMAVVVLLNLKSEETQVKVGVPGEGLSVMSLPPRSISTLLWHHLH